MKKNITLSFFVSLFCLNAIGQEPLPYTTETFSEAYVALDDWSPLNVDPMWDVPIVPLNLQFEFPCFSDTADVVRLSDIAGGIELHMPDGSFHLISATTADISDVLTVLDPAVYEGSTHRYTTVGESPNLIHKLEFNNVGFDWELNMSGTAEFTANFQIWLYENGTIDLRYGPNTVDSISLITPWPASTAGLSSYWNFDLFTANFLWANGDATTPEFPEYIDVEYDSLQVSPDFTGWATWPTDGQVYRFNYDYAPIIGVDEIENSWASIYPNPTSNLLFVDLADNSSEEFTIFDNSGKVVFIAQGSESIDVSGWGKGVYSITSGLKPTLRFIVE